MNNTYATKDFYAAGYFLCSGHKLVFHKRNNGVTTFYFEDEVAIKEAAEKYFMMKASVEPIAYGNSLRVLKSMLHSNDANANRGLYNHVKQYKEIKQQ